MDHLFHDLRYGLRILAKNPGFTLVAVLTLALGIGANTTIFSIINSTLLKPLAYPDAERLVVLFEASPTNLKDINEVSMPNYRDWRKQNTVFTDLALVNVAKYDLASAGHDAEQVFGSRVSAAFFPILSVTPMLGRTFTEDEEQAGNDHEVVLGYGLWNRRYNGDRAIVGKEIRLNGEAYHVVGVMPEGFQFDAGAPNQLWVPPGYSRGDEERGNHSFFAVGRLKPGVPLARAEAEMDTIGRRLAKEYPVDNGGRTVAVQPMAEVGVDNLRSTMLALLAAVGFVLLIACVNVANLMLARGAVRRKEFALRSALGAGRLRVIRQLITESVLLAVLGGAAGVLMAVWALGVMVRVLPQSMYVPFRSMAAISIDGGVLLFAFAVSCLTGVLFGLTPALNAFRTDVNDLLNQGGRSGTNERSTRLRYLLVASEVALTMVVLTGAGLLIGSMARLLREDPGFNPKNVFAMSMAAPQADAYNGPPTDARFCQDLDASVAGVVAVSGVAQLPMQGGAARSFVVEGRPEPGEKNTPGGGYDVACPNYLKTMGIPLLEGREFTHRDVLHGENVAIISQTTARRYWPEGSPIGKRIRVMPVHADTPWLTIVGVFGDVRTRGLDQKPRSLFMRPYTQAAWPRMTIIVRTAAAPAAMVEPVRKALQRSHPDRALSEAETLDQIISNSVSSRRFAMLMLGSLAGLALALAAVGIAGVVSYSVVQRTNEIGIRMALGATGRDVLRLVVGRSMLWAIGGVAPGAAASLLMARLLGGMLYEVKATDPGILGLVGAVLVGVALVASYLPARRATRVDPLVALRWE